MRGAPLRLKNSGTRLSDAYSSLLTQRLSSARVNLHGSSADDRDGSDSCHYLSHTSEALNKLQHYTTVHAIGMRVFRRRE